MLETEIKKLTAALEANTAALGSRNPQPDPAPEAAEDEGKSSSTSEPTTEASTVPDALAVDPENTGASQEATDSALGDADKSTGDQPSKEDLRAKLKELQKVTDVETVGKVLKKFGEGTLSQVPEDHYGPAIMAAEELIEAAA